MSAASDLKTLVQQCEDDTRRLLGYGAAQRLGNWRRHATTDDELVAYIQRLLRGPHRDNGWELKRLGGLSLEGIVIDHRPDLFTEDDRNEARRTLGLSPK